MIILSTNYGDIHIELFEEDAPVSCDNFKQYVEDGHYDGTIFHRVIPNFMIQGGGMDDGMNECSTREPIKNEAANGRENKRGSLAMARTSVVDSATAQFFINLKDNDFLNHSPRDYGYAVFGEVVEGMEIVDKIAGVETGSYGPHQDVPVEPVIINKASSQ